MRKFAFTAIILLLAGCGRSEPAKKAVLSVDSIQGKWKVIEATDPNGNGFEADSVVMEITKDKAVSQGGTLRLAFNADGSYCLLYAQLSKEGTNPPEEKKVGEVAVFLTTELSPPQMLWIERNSKQTTLFQKE